MNEILSLNNAAVVVSGATGFIGSHLIDYLVGHGCTIHALVRETSDQRWLNKSGQVKIHVVDLAQSSSISCLEKADYLFHCAGLTKAKTRDDYFVAMCILARFFMKDAWQLGAISKQLFI